MKQREMQKLLNSKYGSEFPEHVKVYIDETFENVDQNVIDEFDEFSLYNDFRVYLSIVLYS